MGQVIARTSSIGKLGLSKQAIAERLHHNIRAATEDAIARIRACGKPVGIGSDQALLTRGSEQLVASFKMPA